MHGHSTGSERVDALGRLGGSGIFIPLPPRSTRRRGNHMHDHTRFQCDIEWRHRRLSLSLSLSLSQKSLTHNIGSASALPIIRLCALVADEMSKPLHGRCGLFAHPSTTCENEGCESASLDVEDPSAVSQTLLALMLTIKARETLILIGWRAGMKTLTSKNASFLPLPSLRIPKATSADV